MTDNERVDLDLQEIAEDFVLAWIGRPSTAAAAQLHQHLRHQRRQGRAEGLREQRKTDIGDLCRWCHRGEQPTRAETHWYHFGGVTECAAGPIHEATNKEQSDEG